MVFSDLAAAVFFMTTILQVYVSSQEISPIYISVKECNYLKSTEGQDNAYRYINAKDKICCLCSKGTEWKGDCNSFQPNSTVCKACRWNEDNINDRYYVGFEPHMQKQCFPVEMKNCHPNKIYKDGSATERPSCVCPPGTIKDGKRRCKRVSHTPALDPFAQEITSQPNEVTSSLTKSIRDQAVTQQNTTSRMTKMTKNQSRTSSKAISTELKRGANLIHQTVTHEETITTKEPETSSIDQGSRKPVKTGQYSIYIVVGVILLIVVIILAIVMHKYKPCNDSTKDSPPCSSCDASNEVLTRGSNRCPDVSINLVQYENAAVENNATPTMAREAVGKKRAKTVPLISNEGVGAEEQPPTLRNEVPLQAPPLSAQPTDPVPEEKDFATEVAKELGVVMKKEDAKQIFRHYVSSPRCENELEEIMQKGENSVNTYIAFMSWLKNKRGKELTPEYLLEKSKTMEPFYKIIVETIEDKMKEFGIEVPEEANNDSISECINIL